MRVCRTFTGAADISRGQWGGPISRDNQSTGHAHKGTDQTDESQLHRVQIPSDQSTPLEQGKQRKINLIVSFFKNWIIIEDT